MGANTTPDSDKGALECIQVVAVILLPMHSERILLMKHLMRLAGIVMLTFFTGVSSGISAPNAAPALDIQNVWWYAPAQQLNIQLVLPAVPAEANEMTINYPNDLLALNEDVIPFFNWMRDTSSDWHYVQIGTLQADNATGMITIYLDPPAMERGEFLERFPPLVKIGGSLQIACGQGLEALPAFGLRYTASTGGTFEDVFPGYICQAEPATIQGQFGLLSEDVAWTIDTGDMLAPVLVSITTPAESVDFNCDSLRVRLREDTSIEGDITCSERSIELHLHSSGSARAMIDIATDQPNANRFRICVQSRYDGEGIFAKSLIPGSGVADEFCMESLP